MKKIIALLLALLMVATAVVAASAEATEESATTLTAPKFYGAQTNTDGTAVRFLSTVHSDTDEVEGDAVGYVIKAIFVDGSTQVQNIEYSAAKGESNMETKTIYSAVNAAGAVVTLSEIANGDETAKGILAAVIEGIPATEDVMFEITTYVRVGTDYTYSTPAYQKLSNGKLRTLTDGYEEDFEDVIPLAGSTVTPDISGGTWNLNAPSWGNSRYEIVSRDVFATAPETTMVEMKIDFTYVGTFTVMLNAQADDPNTSKGAILVSLRLGSAAGSYTDADTNTKIDGTRDLYVAAGAIKVSDGKQNLSLLQNKGLEISQGATSASVNKLTIVVKNKTTGCTVYVYIGETCIGSYNLDDNRYRIAANSYVAVWAQKSTCSVDDLKVSTVNGDVTTTAVPTAGNTLYENDFELNVENYGVKAAPEYKTPSLSIQKNKLVSPGGTWKNHAYIVSNGAEFSDCYAIEMQLDIENLGEKDPSILISKAGSASKISDFVTNSIMLQIQDAGQNNFIFRFKRYCNGQYGQDGSTCDANHTAANNNHNYTANKLTNVTHTNFKLTIVVDSTPDNGCLVMAFVDGRYVDSIAVSNAYDVATPADCAVMFWTEIASGGSMDIRLDSIAVKNYTVAEN